MVGLKIESASHKGSLGKGEKEMLNQQESNREDKQIVICENDIAFFNNQVDYCIGTGRMGLALQEAYQEQLKLVQEHIGFKYIRGHGLFCDDMAIYQEYEEDGEMKVEYNYTYLDRVMDSYQKLGLRPFLELGFMPEKLASGSQTIFYWKGNTTPPKSYEKWTTMVKALLEHLIERYGREEVLQWPIEVWNEPNLNGFWENADMKAYFKLFHESFVAIKEVDQRFRVGGPAVCGGSDELWIREFVSYCNENNLPVDFVTRHHYTTEFPEHVGHYGYAKLMDPQLGFDNLHTTREIIDSFPAYKGLEIHITEFNTSYIPNCPLHDTNQNAAYIAHQLSKLGEDNASYSYWTFGDVFEEQGVPFTPFHGGFGLVANGCIPKPTFWTFAFFKKLKEAGGICVYRDENTIVVKRENGTYQGIAWHMTTERSGKEVTLTYTLPAQSLRYAWVMEKVDEVHCNPLKVWHDLGEPASLTKTQQALLRQSAMPFVKSSLLEAPSGKLGFTIDMAENAVVYFEITPMQTKSDRGYDYNRVMQCAEDEKHK